MAASQVDKNQEGVSKYLTFALGEEEYGISIRHVQEIIGLLPITPVPGMPSDVLGVINLRGKIVPVIDLRLKFGMPPTASTHETCIIVVIAGGTETGVLTDRVREVASIPSGAIEPAPAFGSDVDISHVLGIATSTGRTQILLDIEHVLRSRGGGM